VTCPDRIRRRCISAGRTDQHADFTSPAGPGDDFPRRREPTGDTGPLVVALFVEVVDLVVDERTTYQETLETGRWRARDPDTGENPDSDRRSRSDAGAEPTDEDTAAGGDDAPGGADPIG
jgi:hypothetical protein